MFVTILLFCVALVLYWWKLTSGNEPPPSRNATAVRTCGKARRRQQINNNVADLWKFIVESTTACEKSGFLCTLWIGPRKLYIIAHPDDALTMANTFYEKSYIYDFAKPWLGNGLITADAICWKAHRKILNTTFNQQILDGFINIQNDYGRRLVENFSKMSGRGSFDPTPYVRCNALETICSTTLGVDVCENKSLTGKYMEAMESILNLYSERFQNGWLHLDFIWNLSKHKVKEDANIKILNSVSNTIIKTRRNALRQDSNFEHRTGRPFKSFLDLLLEMEVEGNTFSHTDIRNHVETLIAAGHDTSATTLCYTMLLVGSYPRVQERLHAELLEVFGDSYRDVEKKDLPKLVYMEAVLKETLRIYCSVPIIARVLQQDLKIRNFTLKSGSSCIISIYGIHRHPMWGKDVNEFNPERWLDPKTLPENPNAFFAFSLGKRSCIGKTYAMHSMKIVLSHIMRNFSVTGDHKKTELKIDVLLKPVSGHHISIEKRR